MAEQTGQWVQQRPDVKAHECDPPRYQGSFNWEVVDGVGSLWRCECRRLWRVIEVQRVDPDFTYWKKYWVEATVWQRLRHWKAGRHG